MKTAHEWFKQADYDLETAGYMFDGGRYFYAVFLSHLTIEKALKGLYSQALNQMPPKTHNLMYLVEKSGISLPDELFKFIHQLNGVSIPTRYPDDLEHLRKNYSQSKTSILLKKCEECLKWLHAQLKIS